MKFLNIFRKNKSKQFSLEEEKTIRKTAFDEIQKLKRKSSIAKIGGIKPSKEKFKSRFSGDFLMKDDEEWPKWNDKYLDSILQINISELPYIPEEISNYKLITIFIDIENIPFEQKMGDGWEIRFYEELENLDKKCNPNTESNLKSFEINWNLSENEYPSLEDAKSEIDLKQFLELKKPEDQYYENFENNEYTKIGGWPSIIQHELEMNPKNVIFQIGSENKVNLNWIDGGTVYIGKENDEWKFECQFY